MQRGPDSISQGNSAGAVVGTSSGASDSAHAPTLSQPSTQGDGGADFREAQGAGNTNSINSEVPSVITNISTDTSAEPLLSSDSSSAAKGNCSETISGSDTPSPVPLINSRLAARLKDIDGPVNLPMINQSVGDNGKMNRPPTSTNQPVVLARRPGSGRGGHPGSK